MDDKMMWGESNFANAIHKLINILISGNFFARNISYAWWCDQYGPYGMIFVAGK